MRTSKEIQIYVKLVWIVQGDYLNFRQVILLINLLINLDYSESYLDNYSDRGSGKAIDKIHELRESH